MKKSELKNIIKECVKEVIFEEGVLSGIITEVAQGLQGTASASRLSPNSLQEKNTSSAESSQREATKKKVLSAIGGDAYADLKNKFPNPGLFEGTRPAPEGNGSGPLSGVDPGDSGVDLAKIPGMGRWGAIAGRNTD